MASGKKQPGDKLRLKSRLDQRMTSSRRRENPTDWAIKGELFLNCSCEVFCPCVVSLGKHDPTEGSCKAWLGVRIDVGKWGDLSLGGLNVAHLKNAQGGDQLLLGELLAAPVIGQRRQRVDDRETAGELAEIGLDAPQRDDETRLHAERVADLSGQRFGVEAQIARFRPDTDFKLRLTGGQGIADVADPLDI